MLTPDRPPGTVEGCDYLLAVDVDMNTVDGYALSGWDRGYGDLAATSQISYTASKGGVLAMSRELAVQFARQGVRVNALCPGGRDRRGGGVPGQRRRLVRDRGRLRRGRGHHRRLRDASVGSGRCRR